MPKVRNSLLLDTIAHATTVFRPDPRIARDVGALQRAGPAPELNRHQDKAVQAAGRMVYSYPAGDPTRACEDVDVREVMEIGSIEVKTGLIEITARVDDVAWWIKLADVADLGLDARPRS